MIPQHADVVVQSVATSSFASAANSLVTVDVTAEGENTLLIPQSHRTKIDLPMDEQPKVGDKLRLVLLDTKTHHVELNS